MLDIIIPVLNEETILTEQAEYYQNLAKQGNLIFVDGGSEDQTVASALRYGSVISSRRGRSYQKNAGAKHSPAQSPYLLFLNVDSFVDTDCLEALRQACERQTPCGCFTLRIMDSKQIFRSYEWAVNIRARRGGIVDADLGFFIRRDLFESMQGFDQLPIMDDIVFSKRLRKTHAIEVLPHNIQVSSRKWHEQGFTKTFCQYTLAYVQLWTGIPFFKDPVETNTNKYQENHEQHKRAHYIRPRTQSRSG